MRTKPKIKIDLKKVEEAASFCSNNEEIAAYLGISDMTLYARQRESEEFKEAIKRGRAKANAWAGSKLMSLIEEGNTTALIFYLKCKGQWKETQKLELSGKTEVQIAKELSSDALMRIAELDDADTP